MRILNVRFQNLNSLVGEWEVDLTHPAFTAEGIFAITGPTGAGKTTILDAICLAIYGQTPRLNKVTMSSNEIMSRQTGECYAEVTFETQAGRFRCHWSQHRARRRPEGKLQAPKQEIANADTGEIFETKKRGVAEQIELATGMDFDRFTRSMLLAQGGFAAFLTANPDDRAPILEQITGTEIYSQISILVHERHREERSQLELLRAETAGIQLLEPEEEAACQEALKARELESKATAEKTAILKKSIDWLTGIDKLRQEITGLKVQSEALQLEIEGFKPDRERLARADRAAKLDGVYATLSSERAQLAEDQTALKAAEGSLPELEEAQRTQTETHAAAEQQVTQARAALKDTRPQIQKVRSLDQTIADQQAAVTTSKRRLDQDASEIDGLKQRRQEEQDNLAEASKALEQTQRYLKEHARDEPLVAGLAGIEAKLHNLIARQDTITQLQTEQSAAVTSLEQAEVGLTEQQQQIYASQTELTEASRRLNAGQDALQQLLGDSLLREYRAEKESLLREMQLFRQIAALEDHRAQLEDGKPCPLCGAEDHPYAEGNTPKPDTTEERIAELTTLIERAEEQEQTIEGLKQQEQAARGRVHEVQQLETTAKHHKQSAENDLKKVETALKKAQSEFAGAKETITAELQPLGVNELPEQDIESILEALRERRIAWEQQTRQHAKSDQQINAIYSELKRIDALIEQQSKTQQQHKQELDVLEKSLAENIRERQALFGDKDPDAEVQKLEDANAQAEKSELEARELLADQKQQLKVLQSQIQSLQERIKTRTSKLKQSKESFITALQAGEFTDEDAFKAARLSTEERETLAGQAKQLDQRQTELRTRITDREKQLTEEEARKVTEESLEALQPQLDMLEGELDEIRNTVVALKHKLEANAEARERLKAQQQAIDAQVIECRRWDNLHELIGSSDGKKYRNFAQGLTFEMMVGHANRQLQKMTDRYLLIRDVEQPLELNVVDNYQAGEVRSTKNLSGGESFIVSLSLALGLSQMASKNVRVDSLFLDEGFGTLDEEALDTALETLSSLQQEGKLIGVISHVVALKERISTQIQVTPQTGGRSQISGPGCGRSITTEGE